MDLHAPYLAYAAFDLGFRNPQYPGMGDITELLNRAKTGDTQARDQLFAKIYPELKRLARSKLSGESPMTLIDPTVLVQEAYLRLTQQPTLPGTDRKAFFAYASQVMRSVIVEHARTRNALKRGGGDERVTLTAGIAFAPMGDPEVEALDAALKSLHKINDRAHQIVEMRYFGGLSLDEIAAVLDISNATVKRDWLKARAFLFKKLKN